MMSAEYLAGFFDGEGSVGVYASGRNRSYCLRAQITQVRTLETERLLLEMANRFGGSVSTFNKRLRRDALGWQASGDNAAAFLEFILPHLLLKREQAKVAIDYQRVRPRPTRDTATGRMLPLDHNLGREVAERLWEMKWRVMADNANLVDPVTRLRHLAIVKG